MFYYWLVWNVVLNDEYYEFNDEYYGFSYSCILNKETENLFYYCYCQLIGKEIIE